ncbi:MAG: hypothetical protein ACRDIY_10740, partial [Chloroflexota bacterium]
MLADNKTHVGTLRLRTSPSEGSRVRLAVSSLLQSAELRPAALPPSAILVVRRVADPLPRHIAAQPGNPRVNRAWEAAARDALALAYRVAAQPARESVPPSAEAVLFDDAAELLACLALDVRRGQTRERWWWRTLPRTWTTAGPEALQAIFCDHPSVVPAVLHLLAQRGVVWTVIEYLRRAQAATVLAAVAWAYGLPNVGLDEPARLVAHPRTIVPPSGASEVQESPHADTQSAPGPPWSGRTIATTPSPWESWLPSALVSATAAREHVCLVGLALGLYRATTVARSAAFVAATRNWWPAPPPESPSSVIRVSPLPVLDFPSPAVSAAHLT